MKILLLSHAFNSLTQRLFVELNQRGYELSVEFDINDEISIEAVDIFKPDIIIAPYLKRRIPDVIWKKNLCLIVHPGIVGDQGPSSLDWAIINNVSEWGVTVLQANADIDGGDIWASVNFPMRKVSKASLYRNEVTESAVTAVFMALDNYGDSSYKPLPLKQTGKIVKWRQGIKQVDREINWQEDDTRTILRKIRSADGFPGLLDKKLGRELYLYDAINASDFSGVPGQFIGYMGNAVCVATMDGAVSIGHMKDKNSEHPFKLNSRHILEKSRVDIGDNILTEIEADNCINYEEIGEVGYLSFNFYNGAMDTEQCKQLQARFVEAKNQSTKIIVLLGGDDFWSNGLHLNQIEASQSAADESLNNINAMNDLAYEILTTDSHWIISAMQGNAGAGGVFLARAADEVWARSGVVLNPHYKDMGNLFGSEYWTYLLPRFTGEKNSKRISEARLPMGAVEALSLKLVDKIIKASKHDFKRVVDEKCQSLLNLTNEGQDIASKITLKNNQRVEDETIKPLSQYREQELQKMKQNFYGFDPSYHVARYNFVYKIAKSRTPLTLACHRRQSYSTGDIHDKNE